MITKSTPLKEVIKLGKVCHQKNNCCKYGSGCLVKGDVERIAKFLDITVKELKDKYLEDVEKFNTKLFRPRLLRKKDRPYGKCIFLNEQGCKIHEVKPLECRIGNCGTHGEELSKWFMINYLINSDDPESVRQYAIFAKSNKTLKGGELENIVPDKKKLKEILEFRILR
jgi:Fe-S-cluster containining protein|tara:strand:+ start:59 stop:565 length:507 start_codon:yes stop_codon:yes gene_type:complete